MKEKLKELRNKKGVTQKNVADMLQVARTTYCSYEQGLSEPDIGTLIKLANYYNTTVDTILEHEVPNLLNTNTLTSKQKEIIDIVQNMDDEQCRYTLAYIEGFKKGIEERNQKIYNGGNRE